MEKQALPFASTYFSSSLSSSESLAFARRNFNLEKLDFQEIANSKAWVSCFLTRDLCHRCSTKLAFALSNRWCFDFSFLLITSTRGFVYKGFINGDFYAMTVWD
ncbi:hypothetical protein D8674_039386 [Pyrus ussuriensis x Pyrus communis]|uniref:Uncharacterized protein n=1 Tax=Pyrus ussuriensis x Pyrus communis TaxID=2448454 RepID=A0A5N5H111_9ROSA|nr:hypothetical protein D8674_039386 [Pyrus ussuriensis x Pyrus communis]